MSLNMDKLTTNLQLSSFPVHHDSDVCMKIEEFCFEKHFTDEIAVILFILVEEFKQVV